MTTITAPELCAALLVKNPEHEADEFCEEFENGSGRCDKHAKG